MTAIIFGLILGAFLYAALAFPGGIVQATTAGTAHIPTFDPSALLFIGGGMCAVSAGWIVIILVMQLVVRVRVAREMGEEDYHFVGKSAREMIDEIERK